MCSPSLIFHRLALKTVILVYEADFASLFLKLIPRILLSEKSATFREKAINIGLRNAWRDLRYSQAAMLEFPFQGADPCQQELP